MRKISIALLLSLTGVFSMNAQTPFQLYNPTTPTQSLQTQEDANGYVGIGIVQSTITSLSQTAFGVSNLNFQGAMPRCLAGVLNTTTTAPTGNTLPPGNSVYSFSVVRAYTGNIGASITPDLLIDQYGMVGVGGDASAINNGTISAHLYVTDQNGDGNALFAAYTNANNPALTVLGSGAVGIGFASSSTNPNPCALLVSNMTFPSPPSQSVLGVVNTSSTNIPYGNSPFSLAVTRSTPTSNLLDFTVDNNGLVGVGYPAQILFSNGAHLGVIDADNAGTIPLVGVFTNVNNSTGTNLPALAIDYKGYVSIGANLPVSYPAHLYLTDPNNTGTETDPLMSVVTNMNAQSLFIGYNGNVGIGTTTPGQALQVAGTTSTTDFQMTDGATTGYVMVSDGSGNASWTNPNTVAGAGLWAQSGNNIYNTNTANVGVGTSSPLSSLTVSTTNNATLVPQSGIEIDNSYSFLDLSGALTPLSLSIKRSIHHPFSTDSYTDLVVNSSGYVGIGTASPTSALDVYGTGKFENDLNVLGASYTSGNTYEFGTLYTQGTADFNSDVNISGNTYTSTLTMPTGAVAGYVLQSDASGNATWVSPNTVAGAGLWALSGTNIYNTNTGNIGIGTNTPQATLDVQGTVRIGNLTTSSRTGFSIQNPFTDGGYSLYVQYGILTERVKVALTGGGNWSDYVFDKDYKLPQLNEVKEYIAKNHHLPGVPSADDVSCEGIDLGSMDATLLKKIEELTLYVLELKKENEDIKKQIARK